MSTRVKLLRDTAEIRGFARLSLSRKNKEGLLVDLRSPCIHEVLSHRYLNIESTCFCSQKTKRNLQGTWIKTFTRPCVSRILGICSGSADQDIPLSLFNLYSAKIQKPNGALQNKFKNVGKKTKLYTNTGKQLWIQAAGIAPRGSLLYNESVAREMACFYKLSIVRLCFFKN